MKKYGVRFVSEKGTSEFTTVSEQERDELYERIATLDWGGHCKRLTGNNKSPQHYFLRKI